MASAYDLRRSLAAITEDDRATASPVADPPTPLASGSTEAFTVTGLAPGTLCHFALKAVDEAGNWSPLSHAASGTTTDGGSIEEPVLAITPHQLDFGRDGPPQTLMVTNTGTGTLDWTLTPDQPWIGLGPSSGMTTTEPSPVTVVDWRQGLSPGDYSATITATGGTGNPQEVAVTMSVVSISPPEMALVPAGVFVMGDGAASCGEDEREVTLTNDFYLGRHEVTCQQYRDALQWARDHHYVTVRDNWVCDNLDGSTWWLVDMADDSSRVFFSMGTFYVAPGKQDHPMGDVLWFGAVAFCDWLSMMEGRDRAYDHSTWLCNGGDPYGATGYRLPTDAEWEYAAQWDDERISPWGNDPPNCSRANLGTCATSTTPVASYPAAPEALGLYDMLGNVWEWCNDSYQCWLGTSPEVDPVGPAINPYRVMRGGSYDVGWCNSSRTRAHAGDRGSNIGFRCARTQSSTPASIR